MRCTTHISALLRGIKAPYFDGNDLQKFRTLVKGINSSLISHWNNLTCVMGSPLAFAVRTVPINFARSHCHTTKVQSGVPSWTVRSLLSELNDKVTTSCNESAFSPNLPGFCDSTEGKHLLVCSKRKEWSWFQRHLLYRYVECWAER